MSQQDFDITHADTDTGSGFRSAVNAALQALASTSSGASAPGTTYAYQLWADTTNGLLKIRNGANSAWITIGDLTVAFLGLLSLATDQTITAQHTIAPASDKPPFVLGAHAQNQTVTGLKADTAVSAGMKVSSGDTTPATLSDKLLSGNNILMTKGSPGGNETYTVAEKVNRTDTAVALTDNSPAGHVATDASLGNVFTVTIAGNRTIDAPSNPTANQRCVWRIKASGGAYKPTLATSANGFRFLGTVSDTDAITNGKTADLEAMWNAADSYWDVLKWDKGDGAAYGRIARYESAETAIPADGAAVEVSHSLGAVPSIFTVSLRCKTTDKGYAVGDEIIIESGSNSFRAKTCYANSTKVGFAKSNLEALTDKDGTNISDITEGNWKLVFRAWLIS